MMKKRRFAAVLLLAASLCGASVFCTGCGNNSSTGGESVYMPEVPDSRISEDVPGKEYKAGIGETVSYDGKLDIALNKVVEIDDVDKTQYRVLIAELTIKNNSSAKIDCSALTHFKVYIDGELSKDAVRDVQAAVAARKYYTAINSTMDVLNQEIASGESASGYVYIFAPPAWKEMQLNYMPYKYYSNDTVIFDLDEGKLEHYTEKFSD